MRCRPDAIIRRQRDCAVFKITTLSTPGAAILNSSLVRHFLDLNVDNLFNRRASIQGSNGRSLCSRRLGPMTRWLRRRGKRSVLCAKFAGRKSDVMPEEFREVIRIWKSHCHPDLGDGKRGAE